MVRVFVRLRETLASHKALAAKFAEFEQRLETHDKAIGEIIDAIRALMMPPQKHVRQIGFRASALSVVPRQVSKIISAVPRSSPTDSLFPSTEDHRVLKSSGCRE